MHSIPGLKRIVLCIGDKSNKKRFYTEILTAIADETYALHLSTLEEINLMARSLQELLARDRSPESQARIQNGWWITFRRVSFTLSEKRVKISQKELLQRGIKQPSLSAIENRGHDLKISTMKKYVEQWVKASYWCKS